MSNDEAFADDVGKAFDERAPDFTKTLNIVVVEKVSAGKSSLINAILQRSRGNPVAKVGARSGVTSRIEVFKLDEHVCIIDSPGLDDVANERSEVTRNFLESVDVGILVVTGSLDASQESHVDELRVKCKRVFVVLNKIDAWDHLVPAELDSVADQWKRALGIDTLYRTCTKGFDPATRPDLKPDLRGVDDLRTDIETFVEADGKALLLARQMGEKRRYATRIVVASLVAVGGQAFLPASAVFITATQAVAITSLYYLYTGRVLSKSSALSLLPMFTSQTAGTTLFLWAKSFLPPTGVLDAVAAAIAMTVTAAMLVTVSWALATGAEFHEAAKLKKHFNELRVQVGETVSRATWQELKTEAFWGKLLHDLMYA